jgi:hypothetical protein
MKDRKDIFARRRPVGFAAFRRTLFPIGLVVVATIGAGLPSDDASNARRWSGEHPAPPAMLAGSIRSLSALPRPESSKAAWVTRENDRPGTSDWLITSASGGIEGYANKVSAQQGDGVTLFVSTPAARFQVRAFRMGYYQGLWGRLIWTSKWVRGGVQSAPVRTPGTNMIEARWHPSMHLTVTGEWPEGVYLLKLISGSGAQRYVPLTVRNDRSRAALVIQNEVTTWQAYNDWGGYSLYGGSGGAGSRSRVVSFDRPYALFQGGAGILNGNELPFIVLAEKGGYDVTYWTDIDFHERPRLLLNHQALITLGHDEYWSSNMRDMALEARASHGINIAFLGSNADYRHIRLAPSPRGPDRREINYRVATEDPLYGVNNAEVTVEWRRRPVPRPESRLNGGFYQCFGVFAGMHVVVDAPWLFHDTELKRGSVVPGMIRQEVDRVDPSVATPGNIQILAHSPVSCGGRPSFSDVSYYTTRSGAGVFDSGNTNWVGALKCVEPTVMRTCNWKIWRATMNLLDVFGSGPAGERYPSRPNLGRFGIHLRHPIRV